MKFFKSKHGLQKRSVFSSLYKAVPKIAPKIFSMLIAGSVFTTGAALAAAKMDGTGEVVAYDFDASTNRSYQVYVPKSYDGITPAPMIMALHGCVMTNVDALKAWNLDIIADQNNAIVVFPYVGTFPSGTGLRRDHCWGYWFSSMVQEGSRPDTEVDYIYQLAKEVEGNYLIDENRHFITGISSGAAMAVAESVAHNDYWTAAASVAGLAYGDWSVSVINDPEMFKSVDDHVKAINAELDYDRAVPMLLVQSSNDTTVQPRAMELIRDSQLTVWADDLIQDGPTESCAKGGVSCELKTYNGADGTPIIKTMVYDGGPGRKAEYGVGHYWTGGDDDLSVWSNDSDGPNASEQIWRFFEEIAGGGNCAAGDTTAPVSPSGLAVINVTGNSVELSVSANIEDDLRGYKIYRQNGLELSPSVVVSTSINVANLSAETDYQIYARAVDYCGNESAASNSVSFTTTEPEVAPIFTTASGTATDHFNAGRVEVDQYIDLGQKHGFITAFTLWEIADGVWTDIDPTCVDGDCSDCPGPGCPPTGEWSTNSSLAGMEVHTYLPTSTTDNGKRALMITLHGCSQSNEVVRDNWSWADEADQYGMVIAAPMEPGGGEAFSCWDYYGARHSGLNPSRHDDNLINLATIMINDTSLNIDPKQVYISGLSSGGGETFVMGCVAPEIFAGIGINAGPAVGTETGQISAVPFGLNARSVANTCTGFSASDDDFNTQLTSVVQATRDGLVSSDYADLDASAMALVYDAVKDSQRNSIPGGGSEETWSDSEGVRVSKIMVNGLGHNWPAGSDSSGGGFTNHTTIDYPAFLSKFFFDNNRRVEIEDIDWDKDGVLNSVDNCPDDYNPGQADFDNDGLGDLCDDTPNGPDSDGDTIPDLLDNCPNVANPGQEDSDGDGVGDACPNPGIDPDGDGIESSVDNCPLIANADQQDSDQDGEGNVCDDTPFGPDPDGDDVGNVIDNCPNTYNPGQEDDDDNGVGNACEPVDICEDTSTYNYSHKTAGRATSSGSFWLPNYVANGSGDVMPGSTWGTTTLRSFDGTSWALGACP